MYLQITTRCNMKCAHCCYACTAKGQDMSRDIVIAALERCEEYGDCLTIGGGEPTLHPLFWDIIGLSLVHVSPDMGVHVITNGKRTKDAIRLAGLARRGVIGADLSQDDYHEPVAVEVIRAFKEGHKQSFGNDRAPDLRGIRTVRRIMAQGRGKDVAGAISDCVCEDMVVAPDGMIWACGCKKESFGTIRCPQIPDEYYERDSKCSMTVGAKREAA